MSKIAITASVGESWASLVTVTVFFVTRSQGIVLALQATYTQVFFRWVKGIVRSRNSIFRFSAFVLLDLEFLNSAFLSHFAGFLHGESEASVMGFHFSKDTYIPLFIKQYYRMGDDSGSYTDQSSVALGSWESEMTVKPVHLLTSVQGSLRLFF